MEEIRHRVFHCNKHNSLVLEILFGDYSFLFDDIDVIKLFHKDTLSKDALFEKLIRMNISKRAAKNIIKYLKHKKYFKRYKNKFAEFKYFHDLY